MKDIKDKIIEKQDNLINHLYKHLKPGILIGENYHKWYNDKIKIESELTDLKSQLQDKVTTRDLNEIDKARGDRKMHDCICEVCGNQFQSSIADQKICPSCYV